MRRAAEHDGAGAILSELFGGVERAPVQIELRAVRILFELFGFLLKLRVGDRDARLTREPISIYNG